MNPAAPVTRSRTRSSYAAHLLRLRDRLPRALDLLGALEERHGLIALVLGRKRRAEVVERIREVRLVRGPLERSHGLAGDALRLGVAALLQEPCRLVGERDPV